MNDLDLYLAQLDAIHGPPPWDPDLPDLPLYCPTCGGRPPTSPEDGTHDDC